ncbi:hypothetical protein ABT009_42055 [Streptomyces sp. NPDC002896]|uniref:hypothetical protein n=1 Tax=Streptomyces sp. NPDC002896 TaxID=3154438 RepID=UPI0033249D21
MTSPHLIVDTPSGIGRATAGPRGADAVVYTLAGAMRGVAGTHHPRHWDRFTVLRASLGPVDAVQATAPDEMLPRLARSTAGYRPLWWDAHRPSVSLSPLESTAGHAPSEKTAATLTAVLRACADHVAQRTDLPSLLDAARQREIPALLRFLEWSAHNTRAKAARYGQGAAAAPRAQRLVLAAWWTAARWFAAHPHAVLLALLVDFPNSLARRADSMTWWAQYCLTAAGEERGRAERAQAEAAFLRAQQRPHRHTRCPALVSAD